MIDRETREVIAARQKPHDDSHDLPVWVLEVPLWILAALYIGKVEKIGHLVRCTRTELLRIPGFAGEVGKTVIGPEEVIRIEKGLKKFDQALWDRVR